jgi:hypothetical protein
LAARRGERLSPAWIRRLSGKLAAISSWENEFVTVPLASRSGDTFRFLAATDGTTVSINGAVVATLNREQLCETILAATAHVTANHPILVSQYAHSGLVDNATADPFMMLVPAVNQFLGKYTFTTEVTGLTRRCQFGLRRPWVRGVDGASIPRQNTRPSAVVVIREPECDDRWHAYRS